MKKSVWLLTAPLMFCVLIGCGKKTDEAVPADDLAQTTDVALGEPQSEASPEGVIDRFLSTFFSGKDKEARSLLTPKAQDATGEYFPAITSDTVTWEITKKTVNGDIAYLFVNVSDLTDMGDRSQEELIFVLRRNDNRWGVAGFSAGELAVDYEQTVVETYSESESADRSPLSENAPSSVTAHHPNDGNSF